MSDLIETQPANDSNPEQSRTWFAEICAAGLYITGAAAILYFIGSQFP